MKFTLKFWRWEKYPVDRSIHAINKIQSHFDKKEHEALRNFEESMVLPRQSSDDLALLNSCKMIVEIPFPVSTGAADVKERLKEQGDKRIFQILSTLDNAELRIFDSGNAAPNLIARIKTFRDELKDWRKQISSGDFEIKEIMPFEGFENRFPSGRRAEPFFNKEPEYFRQIFLNPEQDIPFLLEALHRLEFIDEEQQWRVTQYPNPLGPIVALIEFTKHTFLHNLDRAQYERAFCERFIIKRPAKGFEPKNRPFKISKTKMIKYLEQHF